MSSPRFNFATLIPLCAGWLAPNEQNLSPSAAAGYTTFVFQRITPSPTEVVTKL